MSDNPNKKVGSRLLISLLVTLAIGAVWFYVSLPAINLHNTGFYSFVLILLLVYILVYMIALGVDTGERGYRVREYVSFAKRQCKIVLYAIIALIVIFFVGALISAPFLRAGSYHNLLEVSTGDFASDIEELSFDEIPMLDEASASRLGDRKLGELSDMVSQFEVAQEYTQINFQNRPVRVASLEYGDFFKWILNTREGLPAYITVDMVTQEAQVIRTSNLGLGGMRYSPSEFFNRDLERTLRFHYPTYMFSSAHLEIDDDGTPWWVCPRQARTIGLFGGTDIIGAVLLNACTGEMSYYKKSEIPSWVDRVFTADLISEQYNYYGFYIHGFINSLFGQKDVTITTEGSNFLALNDDVYMYTGITSVNSDQSNIGFLLSNQRTKDTTFFSVAGAIESSAQASAMGVVQDLGYTATFPLLLNIGSQPTYFMSLKDSSELVKQYAMVNVSQYQIVATGTSVQETENNYIVKLKQHDIPVSAKGSAAASQPAINGTIADIRTAVLNGNTWYFIRLDGQESFYAISATKDLNLVTLNVGDTVNIQTTVQDDTATVRDADSISTGIPADPVVLEDPEMEPSSKATTSER